MFRGMLAKGLGLLMLVQAVAAPVGAQDDPVSLLTVGRKQEAQARGKKGEERDQVLERAVQIYRGIADRWPDAGEPVSEAWLRIGDIERRREKFEAALAAYAKVSAGAQKVEQKAEALAGEAAVLTRTKKAAEAARRLERIVAECAADPKRSAEACLDLSRLARREKRWREAMTWAQKVLDEKADLWRENVDAADLLCGVLVATHRWGEAAKKLQELDTVLQKRFADGENADSFRKALDNMTVRRQLTPLPLDGAEGETESAEVGGGEVPQD